MSRIDYINSHEEFVRHYPGIPALQPAVEHDWGDHYFTHKFGQNPDVRSGDGVEDVIEIGGTHPGFQTAAVVTVTGAAASDDQAGGVGAQKIIKNA